VTGGSAILRKINSVEKDMMAHQQDFNAIIERCRLSLLINYQGRSRCQAASLLEAEIRLIRRLGFEEAFTQTVEFGDDLRRQKAAFHTIGAGGSSIALYLLGISQVDPVQYGTYFQRLWCTSNGRPPKVTLVVLPGKGKSLQDFSEPECVKVHPMTALEAVPELICRRRPKSGLEVTEDVALKAIQYGDTSGVFQLETEPIRSLLSQIRPQGIGWLAIITALEQVSHSRPDITLEFLSKLPEWKNSSASKKASIRLPILFQEGIMKQLQRKFHVPWAETYRYVQMAARRTENSTERIWETLGLRAEACEADGQERLNHLAEASQWAVCRVHYVANAITSYRAACYRILHPKVFENVLREVRQPGEIQ